MAESIINCKTNSIDIQNAFERLYSIKFRKKLKNIKNPYEKKNPSKSILGILKTLEFITLLKKSFYDLNLKKI